MIDTLKFQREKIKRELGAMAKNDGEDLIAREADLK